MKRMLHFIRVFFLCSIRLILGLVMIGAGVEKVWDISTYLNVFDTSPLFSSAAHLTAIIEMLAGLMVIAGFFIRSSAAFLLLPLIAALLVIPYHPGWFISDYAQAAVLIAFCLVLMTVKKHPFSIPIVISPETSSS